MVEEIDHMQTKGIAVRITEDLYNKIEDQDISRNDLVTEALVKYFEPGQVFEPVITEIPEDIYDEVYSSLYNIEIAPLKTKIDHQIELISMLESQIEKLELDKQFLQDQCNGLIETCKNMKKESFWEKRRKRKQDSLDDDL